MRSKMMASRQYASNQFGVRNGDPKPKRGKKKDNGDAVQVCTKETAKEGKCGAYAGGGQSTGNVQKAKNTKPTSGGEKNKVLNPRQAERRARKFEKARANAPARPMTAADKRKFVGPPTPDYVTKQASKPAPKATLGQKIKAAVTGGRKVKKMTI
jgi:hypothetical protein